MNNFFIKIKMNNLELKSIDVQELDTYEITQIDGRIL
ncbi:hypothetical protein EDF67_103244 [Sphingobacterium sp. JUb78]|nr:hypothetical protein [Sphingobacterium kitahiroshimense]TCR11831.1 hypothetical protein EDF67_103244 [Sphingobacterium sp. JUb78]